MKRAMFLIADHAKRGTFPKSREGLKMRLAADRAFLVAAHPCIESQPWRALSRLSASCPRDGIAAELFERLLELEAVLDDPDATTWQAAQAGISYQNLVMIYRQPQEARDRGKANRQGKAGRQARDELCMEVLRALKIESPSIDKAVARLREAAEELESIAGVEIDAAANTFNFRQRVEGLPDAEEQFSEATIRRHKWPKA